MKTRIIRQYNMEGEHIQDKEVFLSATSIFGKHIKNLGDLKKLINENLAELPDDTPLFFEKIDHANGKIIVEPLLVELAYTKCNNFIIRKRKHTDKIYWKDR